MDIRIYYEDTDAGGVVYYANYLRYFERARTEYFETRGIFIKDCIPKGFFFVVAHQDIDYKLPAFYADVLSIETKVSKISTASVIFEYTVKNKSSSNVICAGNTVLACVNKDIQPVRIPEEIRGKLQP